MSSKFKVQDSKLDEQCVELHEYIRARLNHDWHLETWIDKYRQRLAKYGLEACKLAVDGFCHPPGNWYMKEQAHNAPKLIFRSNKALETFLARIPRTEPDEIEKKLAKKNDEMARVRAELEVRHAGLTRRFQERIKELEEEINPISWEALIKPLVFVGMKDDTVILFHEQAGFVQEYYGEKIVGVLGKPVKIVNSVDV